MARLVTSAEQIEQLKAKASEVRVVRSDKGVKIKLRTPSYLYTYTTNSDEADDLIKGFKDLEVIEYGKSAKESDKDSNKKKKSDKDDESEK